MARHALTLLVAAGLVFAAASVSDGAAADVVVPTISGPQQVAYYATVPLTGIADPGSVVTIYFRDTGTSSFRAERTATADATGHWSASYHARGDYEYYASADGANSPIRRTALVTAVCSTSGPAFTTLPVPPTTLYGTRFATFTATRNGEWAGVANSDADFAVITWRPGGPPTVLGRFDYGNSEWSPRSVQVVGITPSAAIVTKVQTATSPARDYGVVWIGTQEHTLAHSPTWASWAPIGASDTGAIAGWAQTGSGSTARYFAVRWTSPTSGYTVVGTSGSDSIIYAIDGPGDVGYTDASGVTHLVEPSGTDRMLQQPQPYEYPWVGGGPYVYTETSGLSVARWDTRLPDPIPLQMMSAPSLNVYLLAAGPHGEFVTGHDAPRYFRTAAGAYVRIPSEYSTDIVDEPGLAIDARGRLAFTARDGLVHFFTCRVPDAQFGRAARGGEAADVDGDGRADLLAARADGSLWYYRNTGSSTRPFTAAASSQIGSGWQTFSSVVAGDVDGDHRADLLATRADGSLWYYRNTGSSTRPFSAAASSQIGSGWQTFNTILAADVNGDHRADLLATRADGTLWYYRNTGSSTRPFSAAASSQIGSGWQVFRTIVAGDLDGDGHADLVVSRPDGILSYYPYTGNPDHPYATAVEIGSAGWQRFSKILAGDLNADTHAELLATKPDGTLWQFPNSGSPDNPFVTGTQIGAGWQTFTKLA